MLIVVTKCPVKGSAKKWEDLHRSLVTEVKAFAATDGAEEGIPLQCVPS